MVRRQTRHRLAYYLQNQWQRIKRADEVNSPDGMVIYRHLMPGSIGKAADILESVRQGGVAPGRSPANGHATWLRCSTLNGTAGSRAVAAARAPARIG
ncbi:hypothetical protein [Streptomyces sp. NPDC058412]|uniref:hypothetical protein n=1 Tax=Streptomyces sp. NPDC058412 TaxID=3346486 RepID=UPI0036645F8E